MNLDVKVGSGKKVAIFAFSIIFFKSLNFTQKKIQ
jgi:hypothetical protein